MLQLKKNCCLYGHTFSSYAMQREKALYLNVPAFVMYMAIHPDRGMLNLDDEINIFFNSLLLHSPHLFILIIIRASIRFFLCDRYYSGPWKFRSKQDRALPLRNQCCGR